MVDYAQYMHHGTVNGPQLGWFAGICDDLAAEAVRGVQVDVAASGSARPSLGQTWVSQYDAEYPRLVQDWVTEQVHALQRDRERRDRNAAMLLWGIHL